MTTASPLGHALDNAARVWRGLRGAAACIGGAALAVLVFAVTTWLLRWRVANGPVATLCAWSIAALALAGSVWWARRAMGRLTAGVVGQYLERCGAWHHGALTTLLDVSAPGTSAGLHGAAVQQRAAEVNDGGRGALSPAVDRERRRGLGATAVLVCAVVGLVAARPVNGTADAIWHPYNAWRALTAPVQLHARRTMVARGERVVLDVAAFGHRQATLYTRAPGDAWRISRVQLDARGNAAVTTPPLAADLVAQVEADGRRSPEIRVAVRLPAFLGSLTATVHYPAYLGLDDETLPIGGDTLVLPEGTHLDLHGRATTALRAAMLDGPAGTDTLRVQGTAFEGELIPRQSSRWQLRVTALGGDTLQGQLPSLPLQIVADSAPVVELVVPGVDTVATSAMSLGLVIGVRDDHGVTGAWIESRRGASGLVLRTPLALPSGTVDRALLTTTLDLAALHLSPGDTLRYVAAATDNAPVHHVGRSREFLVRIPTAAEQRAARDRATEQAGAAFDSVARESTHAQQAAEDLSRERRRSGDSNAATGADDAAPLSSEAARRASVVAQTAQRVLDDAATLQRNLEQLRQMAQRDGPADSTLARDLGEINQLLDRALSPELRARLAALQQAITSLNAQATQQALQALAQQQAQLQQAMDQARELFKRAALETSITDLAQQAAQLADQQHTQATPHAADDRDVAAHREAELAAHADSLARRVDSVASRVPSAATQQGLHAAGQKVQQASGQMRQQAASAAQGQPASAATAGQKAESDLRNASQQIAQTGKEMQSQMRAEVEQAIAQALAETSRVTRQQLAVAAAMEQGAMLMQARSNQAVIEQAAAKLTSQVDAIAKQNALMSPQAGIALAEARQDMRDAITAVSTANPDTRAASAKANDAVDALAVAAFALVQSKDRVNGSQSGSGVPEAMEAMQRMAGREGELARQGGASLQQGFGSAQQLMQLALEQRALAQQLDHLRAGGLLPGAGDMARQAHELARSLEAGQLNPDVVQGQQRLYTHMLDAGRTLQGQQDDDSRQRHATTAKDAPPAIPPALDARIRYGIGEIHLPSWEALQRLQPEERRRVVEYFQRLTQTPARATLGDSAAGQP
jgi:hypothetical protein